MPRLIAFRPKETIVEGREQANVLGKRHLNEFGGPADLLILAGRMPNVRRVGRSFALQPACPPYRLLERRFSQIAVGAGASLH